MLKIAVCDDDEKICNLLEIILMIPAGYSI